MIHYIVMGTGPQLAFALHGYGETAQNFSCLEKGLRTTHRLVAIDLPFHGKTNWQEGLVMQPLQLLEILELLKVNLSLTGDKAALIGFSFGARLALSMIELYPVMFNRLILLAPDGLVVNKWYWIATQTRVGNRFFAFTMKKPQWFFGLIRIGATIGAVNTSIQKFTKQYIHNDQVRNDLYYRWTCMRKFTPVLKRAKQNILHHTIPVRLLYGAHDKMILPAQGKKFRTRIESLCTLQVIDSGHQVLHERNAHHIVNLFLK